MAKEKLKLVILQKEDPAWIQVANTFSIREENTTEYISFNYQYLIPYSISANQIFYEEGIFGDPANTYIKIFSPNAQNITSGSGTIELVLLTNGVATQLDKTVPFDIGLNNLNMVIDFHSRPDTLEFTKTGINYLSPIPITKADILNHFSDFDSSTIVKVGIECGAITNFKYGGVTYISDTELPIATLDTVGLFYVPDVNPLGYNVEYPFFVIDDTGLKTKA